MPHLDFDVMLNQLFGTVAKASRNFLACFSRFSKLFYLLSWFYLMSKRLTETAQQFIPLAGLAFHVIFPQTLNVMTKFL